MINRILQTVLLSSLGIFFTACLTHQGPEPYFSTPEKATDSLIEALKARDTQKLEMLFGSQYQELLPIDELDKKDVDLFIESYEASHRLDCIEQKSCMLEVGKAAWVFPIPIVRDHEQWIFDVKAGAEIIRFRKIGNNELSAIQAVLAYYDAQMEYVKDDHDSDGVMEYAQKIISSPGKEDGLYYESPMSPLGHLYLDHDMGSYHGYRFKILMAQGESARMGKMSYLKDAKSTEGFALIAWPDRYGQDGVMSFIINQDGIIYEKDMGEKSSQNAEAINVFDPDTSWHKVAHKYAYPDI